VGLPLRLRVWVVCLAAILPIAAGAAEPVQDQAHFESAIRNASTAPSFVLVTIVDDRTGEPRTGCVQAPFLLGAIHMEQDLPYDLPSIDRGLSIALSNPNHVFHFSKEKALDNVAFQYTQEEFEHARQLVRANGLTWLLKAMQAQDKRLGDLLSGSALACVLVENGLSAIKGDMPAVIFAEP
jgi:hypothetical protein